MRMSIVRFTALFVSVSFLFVLSVMAVSGQLDRLLPSILPDDPLSVNNTGKNFTVILDAGHGGEDGGATGIDGASEKELNLAVTLKLRDLLSACGYRVLLTRDTDIMLGSGEKGHKKLADLQYRLDFANSHPEAVLISIHMNKFPQEYCNGIQLYYSPNNEESIKLANALHQLIRTDFQPENNREVKASGSSIYLLDRVRTPAILVECGFLSNQKEAALLKDDHYQKQLALLIYTSLNRYFSSEDAAATE